MEKSKQSNVVLYSRDGSEEQKRKHIGDRLVSMRNESIALDRYHTSNASNQNNNNADVWAIADTDSADQIVQVRMISDNIAVIVLNDNKMVLKAVSSVNFFPNVTFPSHYYQIGVY